MLFSRFVRKAEVGQVLLLSALMLPILLGMTATAVDIGGYADDKRMLQNDADAIALAAVKDMCVPNPNDCTSTTTALTTANAYATKNGIDPSQITVTFDGNTAPPGATPPTVRVTVNKTHDFTFMKVLGINSKGVSAKAAAVKVSIGGTNGVVPWAVTQATVDAAGYGTEIVLKYDSTGGNTGNFGAIQVDGSGSNTYGSDVAFGSTSFLCSVNAPHCANGSCPGSYPDQCAETSPVCNGPDCPPQTGNMVGKTQAGIDFRMNNTCSTNAGTCTTPDATTGAYGCDTFAKVFGTPDANGKYHLAPQCNPWLQGQTCPATPTPCSRRVALIPVVDAFGNGSSTDSVIQRFALVWLDGYNNGTCTGNECDINAKFVNADITTGALAGTFDPTAAVHFSKLTE